MLHRRSFLKLSAAGAFGASATSVLAQQDYPNRAIRILIGFPAGSGADILGRYFTAKLGDVSGQSIIVENKPGANSNIAAGLVANAKPDGYTALFIANSNMAGSRFLFKDLPFDTVKDFVPAAAGGCHRCETFRTTQGARAAHGRVRTGRRGAFPPLRPARGVSRQAPPPRAQSAPAGS
jgi:hypothetical protein